MLQAVLDGIAASIAPNWPNKVLSYRAVELLMLGAGHDSAAHALAQHQRILDEVGAAMSESVSPARAVDFLRQSGAPLLANKLRAALRTGLLLPIRTRRSAKRSVTTSGSTNPRPRMTRLTA